MIYAINKRTKEHRVVPRFGVYSNHDWRYVVADAEGWIPWDSGECPLPDGIAVEYQMGDGVKARCHSAELLRWASSYDLGYGPHYKDNIAYRPILDAKHSEPEAPEWDGEGLPPVGCECEVDWSCGGDWRAVKIIHYSGGKIWVRDTRGDHIIWEDATFRPIRSEEDRAVEEMLSLDCEPHEGMLSRTDFCRALYRAGYRRQAGEPTDCRGPGKCDDPGCPAHYATGEGSGECLSNNFPPIIEDINIDNRDEEVFKLRQALEEMVDTYTELVNSGDAGNWNPEKDQAVIMARIVLAETEK